jgi:glutathione synthase
VSKPPVMAFVMDPIEAVDIDADTTFALMSEAASRGMETLYVAPEAIGVRPGVGPVALAQVATPRREPGNPASLGPLQEVALDDVDVIWQRKDPPVDETYTRTNQMLALCQRALVLNRPESVLAANEKLYALNFSELMPATRVARTLADLEAFRSELAGEMIVKPLDGKGGEGIFHIRKGDPNVRTILETSTAFETRWVMAQAYVPEVREGDKRILMVDGEPLGAVLRIPADGESRANFHSGGQASRVGIDAADQRIIDAVAPRLRDEGLFFVGIDVIGGQLTEINVTSPTGIQEMSRLDDVNYSVRVLDRVVEKLGER